MHCLCEFKHLCPIIISVVTSVNASWHVYLTCQLFNCFVVIQIIKVASWLKWRSLVFKHNRCFGMHYNFDYVQMFGIRDCPEFTRNCKPQQKEGVLLTCPAVVASSGRWKLSVRARTACFRIAVPVVSVVGAFCAFISSGVPDKTPVTCLNVLKMYM